MRTIFHGLLLITAIAGAHQLQAQAHSAAAPIDIADFKVTDHVIVIIFGEQDTLIITQSELERPNLDGSIRNLDDLIFETLIYLDAQRVGMSSSNDDVADRYLKALMRENKINQEQMKQIFENAGYTFEEAKMQLGRLAVVNEMLDFRIRSRLVVPEKEVVRYFNENPKIEPEAFLVERIFVPFPSVRGAQRIAYKNSLPERVASNTPDPTFESMEFWVNEADLAEDKKFLTSLKEGEVSHVLEIDGGYELFRLKQRRAEYEVGLEDRRLEIIEQLRKPRYDKLFDEYKKKLYEQAKIVYLDQDNS